MRNLRLCTLIVFELMLPTQAALGKPLKTFEDLQAQAVTEEKVHCSYTIFLTFLFLPARCRPFWFGGGIINYLPLPAHEGK